MIMPDFDPSDPHYAFDRFGELCFHNNAPGRRHGPEPLAICFTTEDGVLFKHGAEAGVRFHYDRLRAIEPSAQMIVFPMESLRGEHGEAILAEINACLACSGRVANIAERLAHISEPRAAVRHGGAPHPSHAGGQPS